MTARERRATEKSAREAIVGLVVNPASGRDVRRLVAQASVHPISEKCNITLRLLSGLRTAGVGRVVMMPDLAGLSERVCRAIGGNRCPDQWPDVFFVDMPVEGGPEDTAVAVQGMVASGVPVIVVIGGDGTHRLVATVCGDTPILALSSGTNNVFPQLREGTIAGIAAGLVATGKVSKSKVTGRNKVLNIQVDGEDRGLALVDVAVSSEPWIGSKALWRPDTLTQVFVTFASAGSIGLSSIAGLIQPLSRQSRYGLRVDLAPPESAPLTINAPLAPGLIVPVGVSAVCEISPGETHSLNERKGVIALDGEREIEFKPDHRTTVRLDLQGPYTIDIDRVMAVAADEGLLRLRCIDAKETEEYATQQSRPAQSLSNNEIDPRV